MSPATASHCLQLPRIPWPVLLYSLTCALPAVFAQQAPNSDKGEVFELTPFEVSADSQIGYLATETLSGSRLRTQLGDVAASIDVLTEEFLRDVGAVEMYDALDLVGNVSTWNKSGGLTEAENAVWFSSPYMARGFQTSAVTADFFGLGKGPLDFYNRTNITVARGPNAILYGIGSPGGIVNATRNRPVFGKDSGEVQVRTDEYGSFRSTFDLNREIIDDKLAVRLALLYDDRNEFLKPAGHLRKGAYGALTYRPFAKTSISMMVEKGTEDRLFRFTNMQYDAITPWINAGSPVYGGFANNPPIDQSFGSGLDREARIAVMISGQPEIPILNWQNMARTERFEFANYPATQINQIRATGYTQDTAIWAYDKVQLSGTSRARTLDWKDYAVFVTQELFVPELNLELAFNRVETDYMMSSAYGQFFLQMDANQLLPNGQPNPNFGVPYVESDRVESATEVNVSDTLRATVSYQLDLSDKRIGRFSLGRYNIMALYEENRTNSLFASFRRAYDQPIAGFPTNALNNVQNRVRTRTYVDTYLTPAGANVLPYYIDDWTLIDREGARDVWYRHTSPRDINDTRTSYVLALQAFLWRAKQGFDRVILTAGYRIDRQTSQRKEYVANGGVFEGALWRGNPFALDAANYDAVWDGTLNYGTWGQKTVTEEPTRTYSAVFKITNDISIFYNYSDVMISASSLFTDIYDRFVGPTFGETQDIGMRFSLLNGKLVASFTSFKTSAANQRENEVRTVFTPELEDIWAAVDPMGEIHKGFNQRYVTLRDDTSTGLEFTLTANLRPGWSTRLSISQIETIIDSRLPIVSQYIQEFSPLWESKRNDPLSPSDQRNPDYLTVGDAINSLNADIANLQALVGTVPNAQREWKVVFNTAYNFRDGPLKGWGIGGGFRWESSDIIGYAFDTASLADASRPVVVDSTRPFNGKELLDVNCFFSYTKTIKGVWMRFQINVNNLLDDKGTFPRSAVDDLTGNPYYGRQQVKQPRSLTLTTTFKF
jgi:iron complex outermembrane recepter protein